MPGIGKPLSQNTRDNEQNKFCEDSNGFVSVRVCGEVSIGNQQPQSNIKFGISGETLSAVKAVYTDGNSIFLADDSTDFANATVIGITRNAVSGIGENIQYQFDGDFYDSSLNFPANDLIYLGSDGQLTNVAPTTGFMTVIGTSLGSGSIRLNINNPICL